MSLKSIYQKKARTFVRNLKYRGGRLALQMTGQIKPAQAAEWGERLFITPQRFRSTASEQKVLARASHSSLQVGADRLRVWRWGSGPDILLMHGWSGRGGQFAAWVDVLVEAGFRVTILDAPAHGASEGQTASLVQFAAAILEAERQFGPFTAVVGHSLGGAAALVAAGQGLHPQKIVTIGAPADIHAVMHRAFRGKMGLSAKLAAQVVMRLESRFGTPLEALQPQALVSSYRGELLVVHDLDDGEIPWREAEILAYAAPNGQLQTSKGLGHTRILRDPATITRVRDFLLGADPQPLCSPMMGLLLGRDTRL